MRAFFVLDKIGVLILKSFQKELWQMLVDRFRPNSDKAKPNRLSRKDRKGSEFYFFAFFASFAVQYLGCLCNDFIGQALAVFRLQGAAALGAEGIAGVVGRAAFGAAQARCRVFAGAQTRDLALDRVVGGRRGALGGA